MVDIDMWVVAGILEDTILEEAFLRQVVFDNSWVIHIKDIVKRLEAHPLVVQSGRLLVAFIKSEELQVDSTIIDM